MSVKGEFRPGQKVGKEALGELNREPANAGTPRSIPLPTPNPPAAKGAKKASKPRAKKSKLQFIVPAVVLWKLRHAAADEGMSVAQLLMKWIAEPLRQHDYPTMPEWLKRSGESGDDSTLAA